jgi:hypothetical protein
MGRATRRHVPHQLVLASAPACTSALRPVRASTPRLPPSRPQTPDEAKPHHSVGPAPQSSMAVARHFGSSCAVGCRRSPRLPSQTSLPSADCCSRLASVWLSARRIGGSEAPPRHPRGQSPLSTQRPPAQAVKAGAPHRPSRQAQLLRRPATQQSSQVEGSPASDSPPSTDPPSPSGGSPASIASAGQVGVAEQRPAAQANTLGLQLDSSMQGHESRSPRGQQTTHPEVSGAPSS